MENSKLALLNLAIKELNDCFDQEQILRKTLSVAIRIVGADKGSFFTQEDGEPCLGYSMVDSTMSLVPSETVALMLNHGLAGWVRKHREPTLVNNTLEDSRFFIKDDVVQRLSAKSIISVPLLAQQTLLGVLTLSHKEVNYFNETHFNLVSAMAGQAASAILKTKLYHAEKRQRKLADAIATFVGHANLMHDISLLLDQALNTLAELIPFQQGIIFLWDKDYLNVAATRGEFPQTDIQSLSVTLYQDDFALPLLKQHRALFTNNLHSEHSWFNDVSDVQMTGWLGLPLETDDSSLGIITLLRNNHKKFTAKNISDVMPLLRQIELAIKNARLVRQLQVTEKRYTSLFENTSDNLLILSQDGIIKDANRNACKTLRRPKDVLVGSHLALLGNSLSELFVHHKKLLHTQKQIANEIIFQDAYGQPVALEMTAQQVEFDGEPLIQWTGHDVSARRELASMRRDLTHMIVHDLRGPTGTLLGAVQMLQMLTTDIDDPSMQSELEEIFAVANHSGQYLQDLIDSVLDLSKLEQDDFPLAISAISINTLFKTVIEQARPQAEFKSIEVKIPVIEPDIIVNIDYNIVRRVLVNLVDNAIKYTPENGHVWIEFEQREHKFIIKVADDGLGIPPESQKNVFEKFSRATADQTVQGVGLGLAFCKLAIEAHKGEIWLNSVVDKGSQFQFFIPDNLEIQEK